MLILSRKSGERIRVQAGADAIWITVLGIRHGSVRLGFEAPIEVEVHREEIHFSRQQDAERDRQIREGGAA